MWSKFVKLIKKLFGDTETKLFYRYLEILDKYNVCTKTDDGGIEIPLNEWEYLDKSNEDNSVSPQLYQKWILLYSGLEEFIVWKPCYINQAKYRPPYFFDDELKASADKVKEVIEREEV